MTNPLLDAWQTPFGLPPFDVISDEDFAPALDEALAAHDAEIAAIAENPEPASFANTIEALEASGKQLDQVLYPFFALAGADSNETRRALQREFSPRLAGHSSAIYANKALFRRIEDVWAARERLDLTPEQQRLLYLTRRGFVRAGAALEGDDAARMAAIMARLAELGTAFTQNLLEAEASWTLPLDEDAMEGLPAFLQSDARATGKARGADGPLLALTRSAVVPFLQFSPRRDLREKVWRAYSSRGEGQGEADNRAIAAEILSLREERARLLGYDSFAAFKLETEMAGTPGAVEDLLMQVWTPARARAEEDAGVLTAMLEADGISGPLEPWDWRYYAEKRRMQEHALDETALKPYLQLERMIEAAFDVAGKLFGLEFKPAEVPLYHPDCQAWEVYRDGEVKALFVADYFARASKRSGAWCSALKMQGRFPEPSLPVAVNVCNFAQPAGDDPALLSYDDARTLFHEFGHALHHMLSDVTYPSLAGTSVARDFVELPSQLYEHWLEVPEVLSRHARHAETGEAMPQDMLEALLQAANFDTGFQTVEYVASALVDLDFHQGAAPADPVQREAEVLERIGMPRAIGMRHATPHFAHVFAGDGYSSGYYSYMWSEVMDADAFAAFNEAGSAFDETTAKALETEILSTGGSRPPEELYAAFRGRMPGVDALLEGRGLT